MKTFIVALSLIAATSAQVAHLWNGQRPVQEPPANNWQRPVQQPPANNWQRPVQQPPANIWQGPAPQPPANNWQRPVQQPPVNNWDRPVQQPPVNNWNRPVQQPPANNWNQQPNNPIINWNRPRQDIVTIHLPNGQTRCAIRCNRPLNECPPIDCPLPDKPAHNPQCPIPVCTQGLSHFLFPTADPNFYYQCRRSETPGQWEALIRPCGCMTLFNYEEQRCVHEHEFIRQCNATPNPTPRPRVCNVECPTCDGNPPITIEPPPVTTWEPPTTVTTPNGCGCMPCMPWWPCMPCMC